MFTSKYRWMAAFGTSIACHVVVFVVIGVVVALFPSAPVDKGPIQVDLVSLSGGGGGGGGRPDMAMAGGKDATKIDEALRQVEDIVKNLL